MTFFKWSKTAANNATADSTCPFPEGMAASALNDGTRGMMAAASKYRDDTAGAIVTGGTLTAYTVSTFEGFDTLLNLANQVVAFTPHATNGATVTLNVDGLGAKPLRSAPGVELPAGSLILGTPYVALYNNTDGVFYLHGGVGAPNAYSIPLGAGMDFWGPTAPGSNFALAQGQGLSRTVFASLFAMLGTTYGVGDGSTTFNIPNKQGRVSAMKEPAAALLTPTYFGGNSTVLGTVAGSEAATAPLPAHTHGVTDPTHSHTVTSPGQISANVAPLGVVVGVNPSSSGNIAMSVSSAATGISIQSAGAGSGVHANIPPMIICNYIIRIL